MRYFLCIFLLMTFAFPIAAGTQFTLVKDGKPACSIVIAENPKHNAKAGAEELQHYVEKISGAKLQIFSDNDTSIPNSPSILVGRSRFTDAIKDLKIPDGITGNLREEGYIIRSTKDALVLAGNDTEVPDRIGVSPRCPSGDESLTGHSMYLGTRYAVCDLLNRLGVRWFMPGEYGEVVPKASTLTVPELSVEEHPDFPVRQFGAGGCDDQMGRDHYMWLVHNRMNPRSVNWFGLVSDGTIINQMPKDKIKEHPEWFALQPDGSRTLHMPCMSDELRHKDPKYADKPRLLDDFLKMSKEAYEAGQRHTNFAPPDAPSACLCDLCQASSNRFVTGMAIGPTTEYTISQEYFSNFLNPVLEAAAEKFPGYVIATHAYWNRFPPPEVGPEFNRHKNLTIMFADMMACSMHGYDDPRCWQNQQQFNFLKQWCKLSDKCWIFGYNYSIVNTMGTPTPMTRRVTRTIPLSKEAGAIGFCDLDTCDIVKNGIASYVARFALEWDTKSDMKAILADFYSKWFGPAGKPMQDYYDKLERAFDDGPYHSSNYSILPSVYKPELIAALAKDIARAEAAAVSETDKLHVKVERLQFDHLRLFMDVLQAQKELRYKDAAELVRQMQPLKKQMQRICKFAGKSGSDYGGMPYQIERFERFAGRQVLAALPEKARFRTDKHDLGRSERWMEPDYDDSKWQLCSTMMGWQNQGLKDQDGLPMMAKNGYPYTGLGWYRFTFDAPAVPQGKEAALFLPAFVSQAWVWVNGVYIGRTEYASPWWLPQQLDMTITPRLKPGKNVIAIRILEQNQYVGASGIYERPIVYVK